MSYLRYVFLLIICISSAFANENLTKYVNPFIGTDAHGHTFPGATMPFGMVQLSPDTRLDTWDGCSGYHYSDSLIYGFSHTHLNGTGCLDYGDILVLPFSGKNELDNKKYASKFLHSTETALPGFYSVRLENNNIFAELTATPRCGLHRYTFSTDSENKILLDLVHRDVVLSCDFEKINDSIFVGHRHSRSWADNQQLFFAIKFKSAPNSYEVIHDSIFSKFKDKDKNIKVVFDFGNRKEVELTVALSAVSTENALKNLENEADNISFERAKYVADSVWNKELSKILVEGNNEDDKIKFYTALYHCMIQPNLYSDVNGDYRGTDKQIHNANFNYYTVFSLWDTYRAYHPLMTIIDQKRTNDWIKTFQCQFDEGKILPVWELAGNETFCMIGYHSIPVIADAIMKNIGDFDRMKIYNAMKSTALRDDRSLKEYREYGFIPSNLEHESVSKTLEYAFDDYCIAQVAQKLGRSDEAQQFFSRSQYYKNLFDPTTKFMRPRFNGGWLQKFNPTEVNNNYTEGNSWQYSFYVPHDINTLIDLHGGKKLFYQKLSEMFQTNSKLSGREQADLTGLIGQYAHGNEPSHHMAYLYNFINNSNETQKLVRQIMDSLYTSKPGGLCGNEDCGQMSAWFVMSALGFYPICPANNQYLIGSPLFDSATINLENGKQFKIIAKDNSKQNVFIQSAELNGKKYNLSYLSHFDIMNGGILTFSMGPGRSHFAPTDAECPKSRLSNSITISPTIDANIIGKSFKDSLLISINTIDKNALLLYTIDESEPTVKDAKRYDKPFIIKEDTKIRAVAVVDDGISFENSAEFKKYRSDIRIILNTDYHEQYSGGGSNALVDKIRGNVNFRLGGWQGFQGKDFEAIVELNKSKKIKSISVGCLQDTRSWIIFPKEIEYFASKDGKSFKSIGKAYPGYSPENYTPITKDLAIKCNISAKYIKIKAKYFGKLPSWHLGFGGESYIFMDEIIIK